MNRFEFAGATDLGRKRKVNQDNFRADGELNAFVVADGMGGHAGGEYASRVCADTIIKSVREDRQLVSSNSSINPIDLVMGAIHRANTAVYSKGREEEGLRGMGTTVDLLLFDQQTLFIGHVGDSRVYLVRKDQLWQITRDHSLVNEKLKAGLITREQMRTDQNKNVITRSVGFESSVLVDIYRREISPGDLYLACSDGLTGMLDDQEVLNVLNQEAFDRDDLNGAVQKLIDRANDKGGDDNITVVLTKVL